MNLLFFIIYINFCVCIPAYLFRKVYSFDDCTSESDLIRIEVKPLNTNGEWSCFRDPGETVYYVNDTYFNIQPCVANCETVPCTQQDSSMPWESTCVQYPSQFEPYDAQYNFLNEGETITMDKPFVLIKYYDNFFGFNCDEETFLYAELRSDISCSDFDVQSDGSCHFFNARYVRNTCSELCSDLKFPKASNKCSGSDINQFNKYIVLLLLLLFIFIM